MSKSRHVQVVLRRGKAAWVSNLAEGSRLVVASMQSVVYFPCWCVPPISVILPVFLSPSFPSTDDSSLTSSLSPLDLTPPANATLLRFPALFLFLLLSAWIYLLSFSLPFPLCPSPSFSGWHVRVLVCTEKPMLSGHVFQALLLPDSPLGHLRFHADSFCQHLLVTLLFPQLALL